MLFWTELQEVHYLNKGKLSFLTGDFLSTLQHKSHNPPYP